MRVSFDPCQHARCRVLRRGFANNIGVQQISHSRHYPKLTFRAICFRRLPTSGVKSPGQARRAAASDFFGAAVRRYSSAEMTTTAGFPCLVTVCAPFRIAVSTSSLKRLFASCNCHTSVFMPAGTARFLTCLLRFCRQERECRGRPPRPELPTTPPGRGQPGANLMAIEQEFPAAARAGAKA